MTWTWSAMMSEMMNRENDLPAEREFFIDNLQVRIHSIIEMVLVDRPCAMGV